MTRKTYPHMCKDDHREIGFSGDDQCPVCEMRGLAEDLVDQMVTQAFITAMQGGESTPATFRAISDAGKLGIHPWDEETASRDRSRS